MATKLDKDLVRESTDMIDGKSILATLTADQCIELKLKGVRGAGLQRRSIRRRYCSPS